MKGFYKAMQQGHIRLAMTLQHITIKLVAKLLKITISQFFNDALAISIMMNVARDKNRMKCNIKTVVQVYY